MISFSSPVLLVTKRNRGSGEENGVIIWEPKNDAALATDVFRFIDKSIRDKPVSFVS